MARIILRSPKTMLTIAAALFAVFMLVGNMAFPSHQAYAGQNLTVAVAANDTASASTTADQTAKATVKVRARVQYKGWLKTVKAGKMAGTTTKKGLRAFKVSLTGMQGVKGHIKYRTYDMGKGWGAVAKDGKSSGRPSRAVRAVKIWLTGSVSKQFDVWYRVYVKGKGWQPWVKNKTKTGITKNGCYVTAIKVKLAPATGLAVDPTKKKLDGIDIASYQAGLDPGKVDADFIIVKATEGTWYNNPYFKKHADATLASGKLLGAYHFVRTGNAVKQADYFVKAVGPYIGKCALFLDWENRDGDSSTDQGTAWAKKFLDRVYKKTGVKPLIYMSQSVCWNSGWKKVASKYKLWVASYALSYQNRGTGYVSKPKTFYDNDYGPWSSPTIHQYTSNGWISGYNAGLDLDKFYGSAADWQAMAAKS